ncbi:juvenile hormone esterase-like isoform X2 [Penaeus chinensis]|uniref:juvenile hormone esterase-like isoform X2 n=1 Tax=Penaeus chinensis TaxID=139456 RepID=UPI001FB7007F|nr:juvenile hormone esterase-like isoform X2 [Penaeus chinensis]
MMVTRSYTMKLWVPLLLTAWMATLSKAQQQEATTSTEPPMEVRLRQGVITGAQSEAGNGRVFYSFKTIPFAEPPVGDLRFRDPVPAGPWTGVRNGSIATPKCPQLGNTTVEGKEDCLYLSVYTPRPYASDLPVMVWIHGGGFTNGHGEYYGPLPLLTKDVVLVVIQYRLATLGFLSTEDSELPGNLGLKDQTMALLWVQDNIRDLGGDPAKVTLFGESAGAAAVHFHVLSPMSSGLFRRAILQSGTSLCPWASAENHRQVAAKIGQMFNCSGLDDQQSTSSSAFVACLRNAPYEDLISAQKEFVIFNAAPQVMLPRVDGQFLPDYPANLLRKGWYNKVDMISGVTQDEGAVIGLIFTLNKTAANSLVQNFTVNGPVSLLFEAWEDDPEYLARRAYHHYLGAIEVTEEKRDSLIRLSSDRLFDMCHLDAVGQHLRTSHQNVFTYRLQHDGEHQFVFGLFPTVPDWFKSYVGHADDILYLFSGAEGNKTLKQDEDLFVSRIMVELWTNFATFGNPTPDMSLGFKWNPTSFPTDSYLSITSSPTMKTFEDCEIREFWKNMPTKNNKMLYPERFYNCRLPGCIDMYLQ